MNTCRWITNTGELAHWMMSGPGDSKPMPEITYCGRPASRESWWWTSQGYPDDKHVCLRHWLALAKIHYLGEIEDWISRHVKGGFCWHGWFGGGK